MTILRNERLEAVLDEHFPRLVRLARLDSPSALAGCPPEQLFRIELNGIPYEETDLECRLAVGADDAGDASFADYALEIPAMELTLHFRFALYGDEIQFSLPGVEERGDFRMETLYIPEHRLISGLAGEGASYLRYGLWRTNWSLNWLPGCDTGDYAWEHFGRIGDAFAEPGALPTRYACAWNEGLCAVFHTSIHFEPLVTHMDSFAFLPWREDLIFAYSPDGGAQEWTLPAAWEGKGIRAEVLREDGAFQVLPFQVAGRSLCFEAPAGLACRFSVVSP
jgi:hypothetical protein